VIEITEPRGEWCYVQRLATLFVMRIFVILPGGKSRTSGSDDLAGLKLNFKRPSPRHAYDGATK
jgi:hypothetical protein